MKFSITFMKETVTILLLISFLVLLGFHLFIHLSKKEGFEPDSTTPANGKPQKTVTNFKF